MDTSAISAACLTKTFIPFPRKTIHLRPCPLTSDLVSLGDIFNPNFRYYVLDAPNYKTSMAALNMIMTTNAIKVKREGFKINECYPVLNATGLNTFIGVTHISKILFLILYQILCHKK